MKSKDKKVKAEQIKNGKTEKVWQLTRFGVTSYKVNILSLCNTPSNGIMCNQTVVNKHIFVISGTRCKDLQSITNDQEFGPPSKQQLKTRFYLECMVKTKRSRCLHTRKQVIEFSVFGPV